jgi:hypothetical protein
MKKICAAIAMLMIVLSSGCSSDEQKSLDYVKTNGYVVYENLDITVGQSVWDEFISASDAGAICEVPLAFYYTLGDPSHYSPEMYEEEKARYPLLYTKTLSFDGEKYTLTYSDEDGDHVEEYRYMLKLTGDAESATATYSHYVRYVLADDETVTWDEIFRSMVSSQSGAYIRHSVVYTDTWK